MFNLQASEACLFARLGLLSFGQENGQMNNQTIDCHTMSTCSPAKYSRLATKRTIEASAFSYLHHKHGVLYLRIYIYTTDAGFCITLSTPETRGSVSPYTRDTGFCITLHQRHGVLYHLTPETQDLYHLVYTRDTGFCIPLSTRVTRSSVSPGLHQRHGVLYHLIYTRDTGFCITRSTPETRGSVSPDLHQRHGVLYHPVYTRDTGFCITLHPRHGVLYHPIYTRDTGFCITWSTPETRGSVSPGLHQRHGVLYYLVYTRDSGLCIDLWSYLQQISHELLGFFLS